STTFKVTAAYRYEVGGREYTGSRVAISTFSDNLGDFHQQLYSKLYLDRKNNRATAFVDPNHPASATLDRSFRPLVLLFQAAFAVVFGGVGFGLLFGARYGARKLAAEHELKTRYPNEPWRWRQDWAEGRIKSGNRFTAWFATVFAAIWTPISIFVALQVLPAFREGNNAALVGFVFPLAGVFVIVWMVRAWTAVKRFGVSTLVLERTPVALGGRLAGAVRVEAAVPVERELTVSLACVQRYTTAGRQTRSDERIVWQQDWTVARSQCQITPSYTSIPVDAEVPADLPAVNPDDGVSWRLQVKGECPGVDYASRFELPVFATRETAALETAAVAAADESVARGERPDRAKLDALGIVYEQLPRGGEAWTFRRGRHKTVAAMLTLVCAIWTVAIVFMLWLHAPLLFPIVFGLFETLLVWFALDLWVTEYRVTLEDRMLTVTRRGVLGRASPVEIPRAMVRNILAKRGMQAGEKLYYDLKIETDERTLTAASAVPDYHVAAWFARYWMSGGQPVHAA
ncbi:MAG TPA: hypothetical protein VFX89_02985, partial [Gammaproteobacteria bacterium]|nr:hypothetical protein [Gammaproteobacteria bacterium]